jgi:hypothetical protein
MEGMATMNSVTEQTWQRVKDGLDVKQALHAASVRKAQGKALREALNWAYAVSARDYYPKWASYLLDPEFQALGEHHLRDCYLKGVACLDPAELAGFWADQLGGWWMKQRYADELVPVASRFLRSLEADLCAHPEYQSNLHCAAG